MIIGIDWELQPLDGAKLVGANGSPITVHGTVDTNLRFACIDFPAKVVVVDGITAKAILSLDFLKAHECIVNIKKLLEHPKHDVSLLWKEPMPLALWDSCPLPM